MSQQGGGQGGNQGNGNKPQSQPNGPSESIMPPQRKIERIEWPMFTVEFGDDRNRGTFPIDVLKLRVRGSWIKSHFTREKGSRSIGDQMSRMPDIPGIRMDVAPAVGAMRLYDPLEEDTRKMEAIRSAFDEIQGIKQVGAKIGPMQAVEHRLDIHQMKSLLAECAVKLKGRAGDDQYTMTLIRGEVPTLEQLNAMPGRKLYDPWNSSNNKPKFEDQAEEFFDRWSRLELLGNAVASVPGS